MLFIVASRAGIRNLLNLLTMFWKTTCLPTLVALAPYATKYHENGATAPFADEITGRYALVHGLNICRLKCFSSGMNHREALTKGLEDFQRMLTEVRQSNGVLTEQLKQFEARDPPLGRLANLKTLCFAIRCSGCLARQTPRLGLTPCDLLCRVPSTMFGPPTSTWGDN